MEKGDIVDLNIKSLSYGGLGIAHYNDIVVFVRGGLPGQFVKSKILKKNGGKKKSINQKLNPSGFNKPTKITDALAKFLSVEKGTCLPRTDVTRRINAYIKEHNLQGMTRTDKNGIDKNDNRYINTTLPKSDKRYKAATILKKLLVQTTDLSYFNLQTFLSPHFIKEPKKVTA